MQLNLNGTRETMLVKENKIKLFKIPRLFNVKRLQIKKFKIIK